MASQSTALERAFHLAASGNFTTISDIKRALKSEGYGSEQVTGPTLLKQLRLLIQKSATP